MKVKLINRNGRAALIEYQVEGATARGFVPAEALRQDAGQTYESNQYEVDRPTLAAPYGMPWADLVTLPATPQDIEDALHQYGIWTAEDLERNTAQATAAIISVHAREIRELLRAARGYQAELASR